MSTVYIVHAVDTEGPLSETGPSLAVSPEIIEKYDFGSPDFDYASACRQHRTRVLGSWNEIGVMLRACTAPQQRLAMPDSFGDGWVFNWFCMDHVGFVDNPRWRAMGMHVIFDYYHRLVEEQRAGDALHWHFHPMSTYREGHRCATSYINSPGLWEIVARRILDRNWFPRAHRAGFQDERPDSHWFLEQWIPFDFSNTSTTEYDFEANIDLRDGRFSDWRWAPNDWRTYHPSHNCYMLEGACQRKIARCLNVLSRFANLKESDMEAAFRRAADGKPTILGFATHDWRDLLPEMDWVRYLLSHIAPRFPKVRFKFSEAVEAFNAVHPEPPAAPLKLACTLRRTENGLPLRVDIQSIDGKVFGPQPFLAIQTRSRRFIHDNLNYWTSLDSWNYVFDEQSILPDDVKKIGIAANDNSGRQSIHVIDLDERPRDGTDIAF